MANLKYLFLLISMIFLFEGCSYTIDLRKSNATQISGGIQHTIHSPIQYYSTNDKTIINEFLDLLMTSKRISSRRGIGYGYMEIHYDDSTKLKVRLFASDMVYIGDNIREVSSAEIRSILNKINPKIPK